MSDTQAPKIETPTSADEIPGGLFDLEGVSAEEAAAGLFDALGSDDDELFEEPELEQSTPEDGESDDDEDEEIEFDESSDDLDDEDEDDSDEDSEDESDDDEDDEGEDEALYEVPGSDGEKVTLEEALAGYSRTADYTRKRQRDAAEHADAMTEVREVRTKYADGLEKLQETLSQLGPKAPDAALRKTNPGEFAAQTAEYQAYQDTLSRVGEARDNIAEEVSSEVLQARQDHVNNEWAKIVDAVPEWKDSEVATKDLAALRKFAMADYGFAAEEIDQLADSRLFLMLKENHDLKAKRKGGKKKIEQKKKSSKRLAPGSARTPKTRTKGRKKAQKQADQLAASTGSVRDAARAIEMLLDE